MFEEKLGGLVEEGAAWEFGASADADKVSIEELLYHAVAGNAADGLDGGLGDRLSVGDDGKGFHGGAGESLGLATGEEVADELAVFVAGVDFPAFRSLKDGEGATGFIVMLVESSDGFGCFLRGGLPKGSKPIGERIRGGTFVGFA